MLTALMLIAVSGGRKVKSPKSTNDTVTRRTIPTSVRISLAVYSIKSVVLIPLAVRTDRL